jgi:flagellar biosynthesis protein FlhF
MKIKRFQADDMRQALRQVRETLGPDAVILSNRKTDEGIEQVAAVDFDETAFAAAREEAQPAPAAVPSPPRSVVPPAAAGYNWRGRIEEPQPPVAPAKPARPQASEPAAVREVDFSAPPVRESVNSPARTPARTAPPTPEPKEDNNIILLEMRREMENMRRMVRNEFSMLGWGEMGRSQPETQDLYRRLMSLGLSPDLCHGLVRKVEQIDDLEQAWRKALAVLAASIPVYPRDLLNEGGVVALVGPTGVGKTTSIAKLAARFCLRHGKRHLGLISADSYRLGGKDQLTHYARLLDVPVRSVNSAKELEIAINAFTDKRLVLIDTAGMSQRDPKLDEQLAFLAEAHKQVRSLLAISSSTQQAALEQAMQAFKRVEPEACVVTKVDEAAGLGDVFSALIRQGMPLAFITDGQRVPEDIHLPRSQALVNRAVNMSQQYALGQTEQYLALSLGGINADARA